ncbi:heavy metal translocating P-type ATPase [Porphyromonas somerae]|uniref:heavy metal translocating P-type ATPase n=1 Tax=Porphyromonas somerae TaxID=322095 RepID=UPI00037ACF99|nr:heavy metal translocating P-type ATPase [Porphyromonas somerae]BDE82244.1 cadmium/zinc/cobalt-transporting ATPase [Porphyromonas somerae]
MGDNHSQVHGHEEEEVSLKPIFISAAILVLIVVGQHFWSWWPQGWLQDVLYILAFCPVGIPVLIEAWELLWKEHSFFNECALMSIATIGAFCIDQQNEAVLLMLLYQLGEYLQDKAVHKVRRSISKTADVRSQTVLKIEGQETKEIPAKEAQVGDYLRVIPGMRVSLDGKLLSEEALLDLSALTGESMLEEREKGAEILAGSVVSTRPIDIVVTKPYEDSTLARILQMTEEASERKPETERLIRRFARVYTPIVFGLALLVVLAPWIWSLASSSFQYEFSDWLYKALVFLVISCPCALVISVPLTYFSGMGATSRHGLLFKGALYLEELRRITAVVFDKTGTLTVGEFEVKKVLTSSISSEDALGYISAVEAHSSHPMAQAILRHTTNSERKEVKDIEEVTGMGLTAIGSNGERLLVGSERMMLKEGLEVPQSLSPQGESAVLLAIDRAVKATVILSDQIKPQSKATISDLQHLGINKLVMLSGDKPEVVLATAKEIGLQDARGSLLPDDKMRAVEELMVNDRVAFVGDGLNDAPVMTMSHVGIAMGGIASDATIEAADIVIQGNDPYKVVQGIEVSRHTHKIVVQNIIFALGFKFAVMILALLGFASLTLAVLADVGVTLLAVLNSLRALYFRAKTLQE